MQKLWWEFVCIFLFGISIGYIAGITEKLSAVDEKIQRFQKEITDCKERHETCKG